MSLTATKMISALGILQKYPLPESQVIREKEVTVECWDNGVYLIGPPASALSHEDIRRMLELGFSPNAPSTDGRANWDYEE